MCGISGVAGTGSRDWLRDAVKMLAHRGPDASGVTELGGCALGHDRLRILDLRPEADQPMTGEDERVWVVFNGEIYNYPELRTELERRGHVFRTDTDTEVIVHGYEEYGEAMLQRLRGMFAIGLWDSRSSLLLLARDRLGIKPLYYANEGGELRFASEARGLAIGRGLDRAALMSYLRLGWVCGPRTIYEDVSELPPGHLLRLSDGRMAVRRFAGPPHRGSTEGTTAALHEVLRDAVSRHLVSDVPVGLFLSAGVDSVALACLVAELGVSVNCYTVGFGSTGPDESGPAKAVATRLGLAHNSVVVEGSQILDQLGDIVASFDQPTVDGVNTWVVSKAVREAGMTVALSGLGGDELFAGYSTFRQVPRIQRAGQLAGVVPLAARTRARQVADAVITNRRLRAAVGAALTGGSVAAYSAMREVSGPEELTALLGSAGSGLGAVDIESGIDDLDTVTQLELRNYLPAQLLRDTDATSMAHSLEVRVPLLDDRVVDAALAEPDDEQGRTGKLRLAAAAGDEAIHAAAQPKATFSLPFNDWITGPLHQLARGATMRLCEPDVGLERAGIEKMWRRFDAGHLHWRSIWALTALGLWADQRCR